MLVHIHSTQMCMLLLVQVGASNELPESEELDALYDRFLIRRRVSQVTALHLPCPIEASCPSRGESPACTHQMSRMCR